MKPIDQIIEELQQIGIDIPEYIQSGKPENVKAANHRSLETRMNNAILDLVEHIKNLDGDRNVIVGEDDPNTTPPIGAIVGSLYLQKNAAGDNLALYINTGTAEVGWFLFREYTEESKIYGDAPNPNFDSIPGKVGDLYIQTNNGTSTGDILSVWMYIGLAIGDLWFNISAPSGSFNITTKTLTDGQVYNFPSMAKGEAFIIKIIDSDYIPAPSGAVWLGGYGGVLAGDGTLVICLTNSPGGSFSDVGHQFVIINQGKNSEVIFVDELPDENLARTGVIYVLNSNNAMYIWDQQLGDYVLVGDVVPGTLISITEFIDENNNVVVPEANKIYFDTTTEEYYRWDGVQYVSINSNTFAHLNDQQYVKYDESTGRLESGKISETSEGIDVNGNIKTQAVELENETGTPLPNQITRNGNKPKYTDSAGVTKGLVKVHTSVLTDKIAVMTADDEIKPASFPLDNVVKVYGENESGTAVHTEVVQYKAVDNSLTPPTILELIEHNAERVDYPNLNRIYMKCGTVWGYVELNAI